MTDPLEVHARTIHLARTQPATQHVSNSRTIVHLANEVQMLRELLGVADCRYCRGQGWYEDTFTSGERRQVQCEWCDRVRTALGVTDEPVEDDPF